MQDRLANRFDLKSQLTDDVVCVRHLISRLAQSYDQFERIFLPERMIESVIDMKRRNDDIEAVLLKVTLINSIYGTRIYSTLAIAQHIHACAIDMKLESGDPSLIDAIRRGHGIRNSSSEKELDLYSFATKYAALHKPEAFPIYDNLIARLLSNLNKPWKFAVKFRQDELRDFKVFVSVIDSLVTFLDIKANEYRPLDKALWLWAKYQYATDTLMEGERKLIFDEMIRASNFSLQGEQSKQ